MTYPSIQFDATPPAKPECGQPDATQDYTIYVIGLILLVALAAIVMN